MLSFVSAVAVYREKSLEEAVARNKGIVGVPNNLARMMGFDISIDDDENEVVLRDVGMIASNCQELRDAGERLNFLVFDFNRVGSKFANETSFEIAEHIFELHVSTSGRDEVNLSSQARDDIFKGMSQQRESRESGEDFAGFPFLFDNGSAEIWVFLQFSFESGFKLTSKYRDSVAGNSSLL